MEIIFGGIMLAGLAYLVLMIIGGFGDGPDLGIEGALDATGMDAIFGVESDIAGLGCSVLATFMAGLGAVGLTGTLSGWNPLAILLGAVVGGWLLARLAAVVLRFVYRQQSAPVTFSDQDLIGQSARVTIDSAPNTTGEVLIEADTILKYPVQEITGAALKRGDLVDIVDVSGRYLRVKKKR